MPEGHTIHRAARDHARDLAAQTLQVTSPQGRFEGAAEVDGQVLRTVEAHGKHLFYVLAGGHTVHVHLGLCLRARDAGGARGHPCAPRPGPSARG